MSWNPSIQFNKLYQAYVSLSTTALTNPMIANLNMNNFAINNAVSLNAVAGATLVLSADANQGVVVNTKMTIPNHTLVITNNTANDSFRVEDTGADTTTFRIDNDGQVAIRGNPATVLTNAFTVNGTSSFTGAIVSSSTINSGNITSSGTVQGSVLQSTGTLGVNGNSSLTGNLTVNGTVQGLTSITGEYIVSNNTLVVSGLISASSGMKVIGQGTDINNADFSFDSSAKLQKLYQGCIYSSSQLSAIRNITFPSATVMATEFGANSVVRVSLTQPNGGAGFTYNLIGSVANNVLISDSSLVYNSNYTTAHRNYDLIIQNFLDAGVQRCYINTFVLGTVP